mmetsp:Transcript_19609/g.33002  ORF Transcript_19609/g.33002 Transcript_19609/m.33002 type:complete len:113 (+) Transcript_19609:95-433(+)
MAVQVPLFTLHTLDSHLSIIVKQQWTSLNLNYVNGIAEEAFLGIIGPYKNCPERGTDNHSQEFPSIHLQRKQYEYECPSKHQLAQCRHLSRPGGVLGGQGLPGLPPREQARA